MTSWLRRNLAPISNGAWKEIDDNAIGVLRPYLSARKVVDFDGPHGFDYSAVNRGKINIPENHTHQGVDWGIREVLPLVEARVPFVLNQLEIDNYERGAEDIDFSPLEKAALSMAHFEDDVILNGFPDANIEGIVKSSTHNPLPLGKEAENFPQAITEAMQTIQQAGIGGPFTLLLGDKPYRLLMQASASQRYPMTKAIRNLLGGDIVWCSALEGGVLLSSRGGDFVLTVGQDLSIGYASHDREGIELYFCESFTFRVLEPAAAVALT